MKKVVELTYDDLKRYGNLRACDGNWSPELAICFIGVYQSIPKGIKEYEKDKYVKENIGDIFNIEDYPNMMIDIETGKIEVEPCK